MSSAHKIVRTPTGEGANQGANQLDLVRTSEKRVKLELIADHGTIDTWISVEQGANLLGISKRAVQKGCAKRRYTTRTVKSNGGEAYELLLSSLPSEAQIKHWQVVAASSSTSAEHDHSQATQPLGLSERAREIGLLRADIVRLYLQETAGAVAPGGSMVQRKKLFAARFEVGAWPELLERIGTAPSYQTLERWRKTLLDAGGNYEALCTRYGSDSKKGTYQRSVTKVQGELLVKFYLMPSQPPISEAIRLMRQECARLDIPCEQTDATFRRWIMDWKRVNTATTTLMREGSKGLNDKVLPYIERDRWQIETGDMVTADGHVLNFDIINPFSGKPKRMTLVMVYDVHSNFPLGWEIMPSENVQTIAAAYRRAILKLGYVPRGFYLDNGRAFRATYFKGCKDFQQAGLTGLFERLGTQVMHTWAYHGQSKTIERFFGTLAEVERLMPTYRGTSISKKPAHMQRGDFFHRSLRQEIAAHTSLTIEEAHLNIAAWVDDYADRAQQGLNGMTPREAFTASIERVKRQPGFADRMIDQQELDILMLAEKKVTVYRNGVRFNGHHYYHDAMFSLEKGAGRHALMMRYDLQQQDSILVYDKTGTFLCEAARTTTHSPGVRLLGTADDQDRLRTAIDHKRSLQSGTMQTARQFVLEQHLPATPALPEIEEREQDATPLTLPPETAEPRRYKLWFEDDSEDV